MRNELLAILKPSKADMELAPGIQIRVKELSLKERIQWREVAMEADQKTLKSDWIQQLLASTVFDLEDQPIWASATEVDGSEAIISKILKFVQQVNGLASDSVDEAEKN